MWIKLNNNDGEGSTGGGSNCCMEMIEENLYLCNVCKAFREDEEMLFQHWMKQHNFGANMRFMLNFKIAVTTIT